MNSDWIKPVMIVLAVFAFVVLLMNLDQVFPDVDWASINSSIIPLMPWLVAFGVGLFALYYVAGRR